MSNEDLSGLNGANDVETNEEMIAESQGDAAQANAPVMIRADAIRVQPDANGVVVLPAEVALGDIQVVGTDLVISMPDGSQWVIVDGAVFVPQLVIGDVEVPPANLAALLIGEEPEPAAGNNQSSGGNFSVLVPDLGPPHPLGDLLPPTALDYTPPTVEPLGFILDEEDEDNIPDIGIFPDDPDQPGNPGTPGAPGSDAASATVQESGLPARGDEPAGSNSAASSETTTGTIVYVSPDEPHSLSINGVEITTIGQQIQGAHGILTITSIADGAIGYSYALTDNTSGDDTTDDFTVTITDVDGDSATATLTIDIVDDVPVARADTDTILSGEYGPEEGNVISGSETTSGNAGADTEGADGAQVVGVSGAGGAVADFAGSTVVQGMYGTLTINSDGSYSYVRDANSPGGVDDVFEYTLQDGDGDTLSATLTISIEDAGNTITITPDPDTDVPGASGGTQVFEAGLPARGGEPAGSGESADGNPDNNSDMSETATGTINWTDGDGVNVVRIDGVVVTGAGQSIPVEGGTLTVVTYDADANVLTYRYTLADNTSGENTSISFDVSITDADGDTSTDSITIDIVDDEPLANNDSDSVAAGTYGPETGNVITGDGTNEGAGGAGADIEGADGASVTYVVGTGDQTMVDADGESVQGQYGVLTIQADGSYSYVRDAGTPGGVTDVFTYTLTDGDGDSVTATLTFEVGDNGVVVGANALVRVDDDALPGGNPGGVGDDADGANLAGVLSGSGADAPIGFDFSASGAPAGFTYVESGSGILIQQGGVTVITVTLDAATGAYTVTQNAPIDHAAGGNENNVVFNIGYTVTDVDGDSAMGTLTINADDDTPTIGGAEVTVPDLMVDETDLSTDDSADMSGLFTVSAGADGLGSLTYALSLSAEGADSGLVDTATGQSIFLYNNGAGTVEGRVGGMGGTVAFVVSVDASGGVTLDQQRAVVHPDSPNNYDETISVDGGVLSLTATVTDGDGDSASQSVDIGGALNFDDDGPSASVAEGFQAPSLAVDETNLGVDDTGNSYAGAFDLDGGADGSQSVAYSFTITQGADSGLMTTDGTKIYLYTDVQGNVEGRVGGEGGAVAFEIRVDAGGNVTLDQILSLKHPNVNSDNEPVSPVAGSIQLTATVTDGDDDTASATIDLSDDISFRDDGPTIGRAEVSVPVLAVDETDLSVDDDANALASLFASSYGADGAGSITYALTLSSQGVDSGLDATDGTSIYLFNNGDGTVEGRVGGELGAVAFTVTVDGSGNVSLDQILSLYHPDATNPNDQVDIADGVLSMKATITDGDGDSASQSVDIGGNLNFDDDGPSVTATITNENSGMATTDDDGTPNSDSFELGDIFSYTPTYGADGQGAAVSEVFTLSLAIGEGVDSGLRSGGQIVYLYVNDAGTMVTASTEANETDAMNNGSSRVFTVDVDSDGTVTLTQYDVLDHAEGSDLLTLPGGLINADYSVTVTDGDMDQATDATQSIDLGGNLKIEDSQPVAVDDGNGLNEGDANVVGNVLANDTQGADNSIMVVNAVKGDGDAVNVPGAPAVFPIVIVGDYGTLSINADGSYTYTLDNSDSDVSGLGQGDQLFDEFTYTMSDFDNDSDAAVLTITITGENDTPTVNAQSGSVSEEDVSFNGLPDSNGVSDDTNLDTDSGSFTASDPDGDPLTFSIGLPSGDYYAADGTIVVWEQVSPNQVVGHYGALNGPPVITVNVDSAGNWSVDLDMPMLHGSAPPTEGDGNIEGAFDITFPVSVSDGFVSTPTTLTINVEDDKPIVTAGTGNPGLLQTDDTTLGSDTADYSSSFDIQFGGDGSNGPNDASGTSFALSFVAGSTGVFDTATGLEVQLRAGSVLGTVEGFVNDGSDHVVFTLSVSSSGVVTLEQDRSVFHTDSPGNYNEATSFSNATTASISLTATATDEDGDFASHTIKITDDISFLDDGPSVTASATNEAAGMAITSDATLGSDSFELGSIFGFTADAGNDGQQSLSETFTLSLGIADGGDSGWSTGGAAVYLYINDAGTLVTASTSATEVGISGSNTVFTVSVDGDGTVTLNQDMALDHVGPGNDSQLVLSNGLIYADYDVSVTDGDNDIATDSAQIDLGGNLKFNDDTPTTTENGSFSGTLVLDETKPEGTDNGGPNASLGDMSETTMANAVSASFTVDLGNDLPGTVTYALQLTLANGSSEIGSGLFALDTSDTQIAADDSDGYGQGAEIVLVNDGGVIKGVVGGDLANPYFTISINGSGDVTFTQLRNIYHSDPADNDDSESLITDGGTLSVVATAEDFDGDTASDSIDLSDGTFRIEDDGPSYFDPEDAPDIQNDASGGFTGDLDVNAMISAYLGTDGGTVRFPDSLDGDDSGMNSNGVDIIWNVSADGQTLTGMAGANTILTITLDQDASTYTLDMNGSVDAFTDFTFTDQNADFIGGANAWFGITADVGNSDVLITPNNGSKVNTSDFVGGVDDGNSLKVGEFIQLDYVTNLAGAPRSSGYDQVGATHTFDVHYKTNGGTVLFVKSGSNSQTSTIKVAAFDDADGNGNNVRDGGDRTADPITSIIIAYDGVSSGPITSDGVYSVNGRSYTVDFNGGTVDVTGVLSGTGANSPGTSIAAFTDSGYNSLVFSHVAGTDVKFGGFGAQIPSTDPVDFSLPIQIIDGDGDIAFGDDLDFSLVASGGATAAAVEKIALGDTHLQAANDDFALFDSDARSLAMSSAIAIGFASTMPAKFAGLGDFVGASPVKAADYVASAHTVDIDFASNAGQSGGFEAWGGVGQTVQPASVGRSSMVETREAVDLSLDGGQDAPISQPSELPQGEPANGAVAEQITIDGGDIAMPDAAALAAMVAANGEGADLAVVAKDAIVDGGGGEASVDALIDAVTGHGGHDAAQTLMVVGQEAVDFGGHMAANVDTILTDAMLLADHAVAPAVNG